MIPLHPKQCLSERHWRRGGDARGRRQRYALQMLCCSRFSNMLLFSAEFGFQDTHREDLNAQRQSLLPLCEELCWARVILADPRLFLPQTSKVAKRTWTQDTNKGPDSGGRSMALCDRKDGCGRQREQICRNRPYEGKGLRTRSGTCRTRRDQCCSGLPAGCSSRQRSCCRCQTQDLRRPAR